MTKDELLDYLDMKAKGTIRGSAKLAIDETTFVYLDENGAREVSDDQEADVTMRASFEVFLRIVEGEQNPAMAFMSGKLKVEGNNMRALKVSEILSKNSD